MQAEAQLEIGLYCCNQAVNLYGGIARHCRQGRNKQMGACAVSRPSSAVKNRTSIPSPDEPSLFAKSRPAPASLSGSNSMKQSLLCFGRSPGGTQILSPRLTPFESRASLQTRRL